MMTSIDDSRLRSLVDRLDLEHKVLLLTGQDFWSTWPLDEIGLRSIVFSDGPSGVRGVVWDERDPSLNLPSGTALSASWDRALARRYGGVLAMEARRKNADVVLGPTINLHRSPLGGRHFEAFSEDPLLTAEIAAAYVDGLQSNGIAATPKHYVANEAETERFTADSVVSPRALHELYLAAFSKAVIESRTWAVMSAYNSINGVTASENALLENPLRSQWSFDGVVVSDWTAVRSVAAANAEQDLAMPGPEGAWGERLIAAVRSGAVSEGDIDRKVLRILGLAARVGALEGFERAVSDPELVEDGVAFAREVSVAGTVLVQNNGLLPLGVAPRSIAVIGHNATAARTMGGGSATVIPGHVVTPLAGIRRAFPDAEVTYHVGAVVQSGLEGLSLNELSNPVTGEAGLRVAFLNSRGETIYTEDRRATQLVWLGSRVPISDTTRLDLETIWSPSITQVVRFGIAAAGHAELEVNGAPAWQTTLPVSGDDLAMALLSPRMDTTEIAVEAGQNYHLRIRFDRVIAAEAVDHAMSFSFGLVPSIRDPEVLLDEAEAAARAADVVVLIVGTNSEVESEGFDRKNLDLPGAQDELARRVLAANPQSIVVINSGAPVVLPWRNQAGAILIGWFGGQEFGNAVADVISGVAEPGGRLPTTWPKVLEDVPVLDVTPVNGAVVYHEDIHIGYRAWLRSHRVPAWPFGHGLGYTSWRLISVSTPRSIAPGMTITVNVGLTNTGDRPGKQVVQVYASRVRSTIDRPVRWLVGFEGVWLEPGQTTVVSLSISSQAFAHWENEGWQYEPGEFTLSAGFNSEALVGASAVVMTA